MVRGVQLKQTSHAVNVRKSGASLYLSIPVEIVRKWAVKSNSLFLVLVDDSEKVVAYRLVAEEPE